MLNTSTSPDALRIGSLFSGYGGLDMAAREFLGGGRVAWHSDIKPAAVRLLAHRYPDVPNLGDLTALFPVDTSADLLDEDGAPLGDLDPRRWLPVTADVDPIDVLTFGWPCQPHSSAGKRLGEADPRALLRNVLRAVGHLRPRILLGENVARVTSNGELRRALRALAALGYVGAWRCVTAADGVGAPHKRDRLALLAVRADAAADLHGERLAGWTERDGAPVGPGERALRGVDADGRGVLGSDRLTLLPTPTQNMTTEPARQGREGGMNLQTAAATLLPTPKASDGPKGGPGMRGSSGDLAMPSVAVQMDGSRWGVYADAIERWERTLGRSAPAPTMTSPRTGGPQLSPRFVEWMMGLPEGWVCDVPDLAPRPAGQRNAALSLLGDGVVPQQLAHGYRLAAADLAASLPAIVDPAA